MQGHYTGVGSDIEVSQRLLEVGPARAGPRALPGIVLRDPAELHDLVMSHSQPDAPLTLSDVREDA